MQESLAFTPQLAASSIAQWLWLAPAVPVVAPNWKPPTVGMMVSHWMVLLAL